MKLISRTLLPVAAGIILSFNLSGCSANETNDIPAISQAEEVNQPILSKPESQGKFGRPFASYFGDLSQFHYVEEEYFLEGNAADYIPQGELTRDGKWQLLKGEEHPYKTRILVRHPEKPEDFNGMVLLVNGGGEAPFLEGSSITLGQVRDDLTIPVFSINSENESVIYRPFKQDNSKYFCSWEVAGTGHVSKERTELNRFRALRDGVSSPIFDVYYMAAGWMQPDWGIALGAALEEMNEWIDTGKNPPQFPAIEMDESGNILRDEYGNAKGGLRLPDLEVPIAAYTGVNYGFGGMEKPFSTEQLKMLYPTHEDYVNKVTDAARSAAEVGAIPESMVDFYINKAEKSFVPEYSIDEILGRAATTLPESVKRVL